MTPGMCTSTLPTIIITRVKQEGPETGNTNAD